MSHSSFDSGIPVLTEIIATPAGLASTPPTATAQVAADEVATSIPIESWIDEEWSRMERKIYESVLQQMLEQIDLVLEQRIKASLDAVLQTAIAGLTTEIRQGLQQTLEQVIAEAVTQEIAQMQISEN